MSYYFCIHKNCFHFIIFTLNSNNNNHNNNSNNKINNNHNDDDNNDDDDNDDDKTIAQKFYLIHMYFIKLLYTCLVIFLNGEDNIKVVLFHF